MPDRTYVKVCKVVGVVSKDNPLNTRCVGTKETRSSPVRSVDGYSTKATAHVYSWLSRFAGRISWRPLKAA